MSEVRRWTIYNAPDWDDSVFGPETGPDGAEVIEAAPVIEAVREVRDRAMVSDHFPTRLVDDLLTQLEGEER